MARASDAPGEGFLRADETPHPVILAHAKIFAYRRVVDALG